MRFVNVREFRIHTTQYLNAQEEVVITKYGKPIARLVPETEATLSELLAEVRRIFKRAGITKKRALEAVKRARRKVHGAPQGRPRR